MVQAHDVTVLQNDELNDEALPAPLNLVEDPAGEQLSTVRHLIVLSTLSRLGDVSALIKEANKAHKLRGLLVRSDVDPIWTAVLLDRANVRSLRNLLVHKLPEVRTRVLEAWAAGAQRRLIADATVVGDRLLVVGCDFNRLEIPFSAIPLLATASDSDRSEFEIDEDGSFIFWPSHDVHLDRRALVALVNPAAKRRQELERLAHDTRFGGAIRSIRKQANLTQKQIPGVSARHIRRIEEGLRPRAKTIQKLAQAVQMNVQDYLRALAEEIQSLNEVKSP